jgi:hypothetical protein
MLVTAAPGMLESRVRTQGVAERVAEAGLERLDDEPRAGVGDDVLAQSGALVQSALFLSFPRATAI